ncbi:hypothetical protein FE782_28000 [Paenibacillus antri]|uniref:Uncharacterized protein n=1 Tax=Paenibacillus antri TaxID=2582848 RepID=A0A5R9GC56_9BACL|nr:hypothetical protein [Paenibacillus antri]TLS48985.1 hypothetical protein FE782_28000 [Paenibacillus antri]
MTEAGGSFEIIYGIASLFVWGAAAMSASRLLAAPVRSVLRRRAGRTAGAVVVGALLIGVEGSVRAALAAESGIWRIEDAMPAVAAAAACVAGLRSVPRLLAVSRYAYDSFKEERSAASDPGTVVPIQAAAVICAISFYVTWFDGGLLSAGGAGVAAMGALWAAQRRRHAAARRDGWKRPKPLRRRLRSGTARVRASIGWN